MCCAITLTRTGWCITCRWAARGIRWSTRPRCSLTLNTARGPKSFCGCVIRRAITGLARSLAIVAASPAVEGVVLTPDALVDLGGPLWARPSVRVPFTAVLLGDSDIADLPLDPPRDPVRFLSATPITATEAAWVRLKGADAMRAAWRSDGVDVLDPNRPAAQPH